MGRKARIEVKDGEGALEIVVRPPIPRFILGFIVLFALVWTIVICSIMRGVLTNPAIPNKAGALGDYVFILSYIIIISTLVISGSLAQKEAIEVRPAEISVSLKTWGIGRKRVYDLTGLESFSVSPQGLPFHYTGVYYRAHYRPLMFKFRSPPYPPPLIGRIFPSLGRTVRFGSFLLDREQADEVAELIGRRAGISVRRAA